MDIAELKEMNIASLTQIAKDLNVAGGNRNAQAGVDFQDPASPDRENRIDFLGGSIGDASRRIRIFAGSRLQTTAGAG